MMDTEPIEVAEGMDVFATDEEKLGQVNHVWPAVNDVASGITTAGYFQVDQGGILGIGATHLYVPYSAISALVPGQRVTIGCAKEDCAHLYELEPDFLTRADL